MKLDIYCEQILLGTQIEDKLLNISEIEFGGSCDFQIPELPGRANKIEMTKKKTRFPKGNFHEKEKLAMALHSFANHELLAIEMMACAILLYPHDTPELKQFKKGIVSTLKDEQKHFSLYVKRLNDLGYEFGDFNLNDFFWNQMPNLKTPANYLAVMALTFEAANLDFAHFYKHLFKELGDEETSNILDTVLQDEISHVAFGVNYLTRWKSDKSLWEYYNECLPFPLSPARSKGKVFIEYVREQARMDQDFIEMLKKFDDNFAITKRKEWKK